MIGNPFPFFPLWEDFEQRMKKYYFTGTFNIGERRIGYIRIETWMNYSNGPHIAALEKEIAWMNNNTDALIIDQTNNGGGSSCYLNRVASFFIFEPKDEIKFQLRANRMWLSTMEWWYANAMDDAEKTHALSWLTALRKAVENGDYLSEPLPDCSPIGKIFPYRDKEGKPVLYTHPVLILMNELDFSAADMFPVLMQDIGAAKLFGARTAGAGGSVTGTQMIGNSELSFRVTLSLMYREKEVLTEAGLATHYVENVGAVPDFLYETTLKDHEDGYRSYRTAIEDVILGLIKE
jgi:C-terminal processing protease CtpA/Prc